MNRAIQLSLFSGLVVDILKIIRLILPDCAIGIMSPLYDSIISPRIGDGWIIILKALSFSNVTRAQKKSDLG